jgi:hypothetical protein
LARPVAEAAPVEDRPVVLGQVGQLTPVARHLERCPLAVVEVGVGTGPSQLVVERVDPPGAGQVTVGSSSRPKLHPATINVRPATPKPAERTESTRSARGGGSDASG